MATKFELMKFRLKKNNFWTVSFSNFTRVGRLEKSRKKEDYFSYLSVMPEVEEQVRSRLSLMLPPPEREEGEDEEAE